MSNNKNYQFALRAFGHTVKYPPGNCKDTRLLVPFSSASSNLMMIKKTVEKFLPTGITPIEHSLTESAKDFPDTKATNIIILITDGIEECGGDPCRAKQFLASKGIILKPFIVGIGLNPEQIRSYECVGKYFDSEKNDLIQSVSSTIHEYHTLKTTFQINLLSSGGKPEETNTNLTFWDSLLTQYSHNYIHTMNSEHLPDTLTLPLHKTRVQVHTLPPCFSQYTEILPGKHTIIPLTVPQGSLIIYRSQGPFNKNETIKFLIRQSGKKQTFHVQPINTTEKYIIGSYDLEILTLPRIHKNDITIEEKKLTKLTIPNDGQLIVKSLEAGDGCIMQETDQGPQWVVNLKPGNIQEFLLQPGNYILVWRSKRLKSSLYTLQKKFTIHPDESLTLELYKQ